MEQKEKIKALVIELLKNSHDEMLKKIDKALNSGALYLQDPQEKTSKIIYTAILLNEATSSFELMENQTKRDVNNLVCFI